MADDENVRTDTFTVELDEVIQVRDAAKRELDVRIMPWGTVIPSLGGTEEFARGAFADTDPSSVLLVGPEHERHLALGHDGTPVLARHPVGRGIDLEDREDGAYMTFRVANTQKGDEVIALALDGITRGVSVEFAELPGGTTIATRNGRRHRVQQRVRLEAVSPTYRPAFKGAEIVNVRSEGDAPVADETPKVEPKVEPVPAPTVDFAPLIEELRSDKADQKAMIDAVVARMEAIDERTRAAFNVPTPETKPNVSLGDWVATSLRLLTGERIPDAQMRTVADVITTDNAGVVPDAYLTELIGVIDPVRPFMTSTRRLNTPSSGMSLVVPKITQRPTVDVQATEKTELSSQETNITTVTFDAVTKGGVGDLSIQLLKRSDRSFLELWLQLLAEAYAIDCDVEAVRALLDATGGIGAADALDPNDLALGAAFVASYDAMKRAPDTIWLSTDAISEFIDAKADGTNMPLYSSLTSNITAGGGAQGTISGLRAVHTPALDAHGAFAIVGPSAGFAWAEDGTYTLQVDVPSKAGRDVALVGMLWFCPWYPAAFTVYNVAS